VRRIDVAAGAAAGYPVLVVDEPAAAVRDLLDRHPGRRPALLADEAVAATHAPAILDAARSADRSAELFTFPSGEASKSRAHWAALTDAMIDAGYGRDSIVVAVGGGVACDLAGFVAATYMRGVPLVQVPTSLLAMVDASVGGKTGIDVPGGKNLVGAFHPPAGVVIGLRTLATLPAEQLREGLVEALKHGAIADAAYFERVAAGGPSAGGDVAFAADLVSRSVEIKAGVVAADPFEAGRRAILNFGHTVGHAIEAALDYRIGHGSAVGAGMVAEARAGEALGVTASGTAARLAAALRRLGVEAPPDIDVDRLVSAARRDKKNRAGATRAALLERVGAVARAADGGWTLPVPEPVLRTAWEAACRELREV